MADSSAIKGGLAYVELGTVDKALKEGLDKGRKMVDKFGKDMTTWGRRMATLGGGIFGAFTLATQQFASAGDEIAKMSRRTGISVDSLSKLRLIAKLTGSDINALEVGTRRMAASIVDASFGLETYTRIFDALGIQVSDLTGKKPEEQFFMIAGAMAKLEDDTTRAWAAQRLFGRAGTQLIPLFELGAEGIELYSKEAERLGVVFDSKTASAAERLTDMFVRLKEATFGVAKVVAVQLFESFDSILTKMTNFIINVRTFIANNPQLIQNLIQLATVLIVGGLALVGMGKGIQLISRLLSPTGIFIGGLLAILAWGGALGGVTDKWREFINSFEIGGQTISYWIGVIKQMWDELAPVWRAGLDVLEDAFGVFLQALKIGLIKLEMEIAAGISRMFYNISATLSKTISSTGLSRWGRKIAKDLQLLSQQLGNTAAQAATDWQRILVPEQRHLDLQRSMLKMSFSRLKTIAEGQLGNIQALISKSFGTIFSGVLPAGGAQTFMDLFKGLDQQFNEFKREQSLAGAPVAAGVGVAPDVAVAGTFSARAAAGLAGMGVFNQQLNAQQQMVGLLSSINNKTPEEPTAIAG